MTVYQCILWKEDGLEFDDRAFVQGRNVQNRLAMLNEGIEPKHRWSLWEIKETKIVDSEQSSLISRPVPALEEFPYTLDEEKVIAVARISHYSAEWVRKILTVMTDDNLLYLDEQTSHQHFLSNASVEDLARYVDASTDTYYRAIER